MPIYILNEELLQLTRDCIFSLRGQYDELIIVDDCSPLNTGEFRFSGRIVSNDTNLGYIRSANRGFREASGEQIVLVCNDTRLVSGSLKDLSQDGYAFPTFEGKDRPFWDGAFYSFKKPLRGLYDERYKTYFGDLDKFYQAKQDKLPLNRVESVVVWHKQSATTSQVGRNQMYDADYEAFKKKWGFDPIPRYHDLL